MGSKAETIIDATGPGGSVTFTTFQHQEKKTTHIFNMGLDDFDKNEMINKVTGVLSGVVALSGVAMVVGGIVVLAIDCPPPNHPWVLLVWGLVTIMLYGLVVIAAHDRMRSARENTAPNQLVQGLKHLASLDGASAWWFAKVLIGNFTDGSGMGCTEDAIMAGFVLCVITLAIRVFYGLVLLGMVFYCCFKKS